MPIPIATKIQKLRQIRPGWMASDTPAWTGSSSNANATTQMTLPCRSFSRPKDGNISVECRIGEYAADLEADLVTHHGIWGASRPRTLLAEAEHLNLDDPNSWAWLSDRLAELQADQQR